MNPFFKNLALWLVIGLIMVLVFNIFNQTQPMQKELIFSDFMSKVERGEVAEVTLRGSDITGRLTDNSVFRSYAPDAARPIMARPASWAKPSSPSANCTPRG